MDDAEQSVLKMRVSLIEQILINVWVSELATTAARSRSDAQQLAAGRVEEFSGAILGHSRVEKDVSELFSQHVQSLKSLINTVR
jgi:hypothetical protein